MKSKLITFVLRGLLFCIRMIPRGLVSPIALLLGGIAPSLFKRDAALIASNVKRVFHLAPHSNFSKAFQKQVFRAQIAVGLETMNEQMAPARLVSYLGWTEFHAEVNRLLGQGKGLIVVTAHLGSWEFNARAVAEATGTTFHALAKPSKLPEFTRILGELRGRGNTKVLWTDSKNILRDMIKVLKDRGVLGFVMDQKPEGRVGPIVEFLGQSTEFVTGPAKLAIRHRAPVIALFCIRTAPWEYRIIQETLLEGDHEVTDESELTQKMAAAIDRVVRLYPEQWIWNYKRWRNQHLIGKTGSIGPF